MPFLATNIEARPALLHVMDIDGADSKRPWGGGPSHDGRQPPSRRARMAEVLLCTGYCMDLLLVVMLIPASRLV
jgi:hypothetical protein